MVVEPFSKQRVVPVYGVPGAGKTTRLIEIMKQIIESGVPPQQISFCSFTRTASYEGRDRAAAALGIPKGRFGFYATIHSLCLNTVRPKPKILDTDDYRAIAAVSGDLAIRGNYSFKPIAEDGITYGNGPGDFVIATITLARSHMIPLAELLEDLHVLSDLELREISPRAVLDFNEALEAYKREHRMVDFSDMLELGRRAAPLPVSHAFIDEAQDLTNLQWLAVEALLRDAETIWIGGDDDQAIYDFSGGNSEVFRAMGTRPDTIKLEHSHRCPRKVFEVAEEILPRIEDRVPKRVIPQDREGTIGIVHSLNEVAEELGTGDWLFLVRQHSHAKEIEDFLHDQYRLFRNSRGAASITDAQWQLIRLHERLRHGQPAYATELPNYYKHLKVGHCVRQGFKTTIAEKLGVEKSRRRRSGNERTVEPAELVSDYGLLPEALLMPWFEALVEIPRQKREYIQGVLERGERERKPRIKVSTVHAAKGTQAQNVVVCARLGKLSRLSLDRGKLDEYRAAYVAVTRAQERLLLYLSLQDDDWTLYREIFSNVMRRS